MTNIEQASEVLRFWTKTLGSADQLRPTHEKPAGFAVKTFFVIGEQGKRFVLKNVQGAPNVNRLEGEYHLLQHLHRCGIPVAVPVLADEGLLSVERAHGIYQLYPVLPTPGGESFSFNVRAAYANTGSAIAQLHQALASYSGCIDSWTMNLPKTLAEEAIPQIRQGLSREALTRFEQTWVALQPELTNALTDLPIQHIHGDCHGGNLLLNGNEVAGIIDLDHLPVGPRLYDIGYYLADRAKARFTGNSADARWEHDRWLDNFTHVLAGYERLTPLSTQERQALWCIMLAIQLLFAYWLFKYENAEVAQQNLAAFYWIYEQKAGIEQRIINVREQA